MGVSPQKNCIAALVSGIQLVTLFAMAALAGFMTPEGTLQALVNSSLLPTHGQQTSVQPQLDNSFKIAGFKPRKVKGPKGPTGGAGTRLTA
ncbi:hypothetical protein [Leptothermofonsia sp. ETS-13]|uniref:hypothetical protein n=1 Tax=Leptothermofonsia sp. ETS-13 TaxID=3035696 RepID=UPI003BA2C582